MFTNDNLKNLMSESLNSFIEAGIDAGKKAWTIFIDDLASQMSGNDNEQIEEDLLKKEVYIDTCSLMHQGAEKFFSRYVPLFEQYGKKINTLSCCIKEIEKHLSGDNRYKKLMAQTAKGYIDSLINADLLNVVDYSDDVFADGDFASLFTKRRIKEEILFITQEGNLSIDIYNLNNMRSIKGHDITVRSLNEDGDLILNSKLDEYLNGSNEKTDEEPEYESGEEFEDEFDDEFYNDYEYDFDDRNVNYERSRNNNTWYYAGRQNNIILDDEHQKKFIINGYEVDEKTVAQIINHANATGEMYVF